MSSTAQSPGSHLNHSQRAEFRKWIRSRFLERRRKNPQYSLRAFARTLGIEASSVSQFMTGKRAPSKKALMQICEKLSVTPEEIRHLGMLATKPTVEFVPVAADTFAVLADWYHFAILELTYVNDFRSDARWIARALSAPLEEVKDAIERMIRLGLLRNQDGKLTKTKRSLTNHTGFETSAARKRLQSQVISKALSAVDDVPQGEKDITSMTMAVDLKNLELARELITKFRRDLCSLLEDGDPSRVYHLAVQLYPVSKDQR